MQSAQSMGIEQGNSERHHLCKKAAWPLDAKCAIEQEGATLPAKD
jgi:hypothetical protein